MSKCGFFAVRELQSPCALRGCHGFGHLLCGHWKQGEDQIHSHFLYSPSVQMLVQERHTQKSHFLHMHTPRQL